MKLGVRIKTSFLNLTQSSSIWPSRNKLVSLSVSSEANYIPALLTWLVLVEVQRGEDVIINILSWCDELHFTPLTWWLWPSQ